MPYIKQEDRIDYLDNIEDVIGILTTGDKDPHPGELNFYVSSIIWKLFDRKPSYTLGNSLVGVLECVKQEFIRRRLNTYEDQKIEENGDLE